MTYDIVTIGNAVLDLLFTLPPTDSRFRFDKEQHELCLGSGRKILAESLHAAAGGGAVRVGAALARLGKKSAIITEVGQDLFGEQIIAALTQSGVATEHIVRSDRQTPCTVGLSCQGERTLVTSLPEYEHNFSLNEAEAEWVYLAALGEKWQEAYDHIAGVVREKERKLAFNPGPSQFTKGTASFAKVLEVTEILFVNKEEAQQIVGDTTDQIQTLLQSVQAMGPKVAVITDGTVGAYAVDASGSMYHLAILPAEVVEKTGAGDAFASGFVAAILEGNDAQEAMRWGTAHSASVISKIGAHEGMLTREELSVMAHRSDMPPVEKL